MYSQVGLSFKDVVAGIVTWPIRWENENWGELVLIGDGDMPVSAQGEPISCIEGEIIVVADESCIGELGVAKIQSRMTGWVYFYLSVKKGIGTGEIDLQIDKLWTGLKGKTIYSAPMVGRQISVGNPVFDEDVGRYQDGNRFGKVVRFEWFYDYLA